MFMLNHTNLMILNDDTCNLCNPILDCQTLLYIVFHEICLVLISGLLSIFYRFPLKDNVEQMTPASLSLMSTSNSRKGISSQLWYSH